MKIRQLQARTKTFAKFKILEANGYQYPEKGDKMKLPEATSKRYELLVTLLRFARMQHGYLVSTGLAK